jgi:hypothetical protein
MNFMNMFPKCIGGIICKYANFPEIFNQCSYLRTRTQCRPESKNMPIYLQECFDTLFTTLKYRNDANSYLIGSMRLMYRGENSLHTFDRKFRYMLHQMANYTQIKLVKVPFKVVYKYRTDMKQLNGRRNPRNNSYGFYHRNEVTSYVYNY